MTRWVRAAGLLLALASLLPVPPAAAVQLGGTLDLGTGPASWDEGGTDRSGALTQGAFGGWYRMPTVFGLAPEVAGDLRMMGEPSARTAMQWEIGTRLHTAGARRGVWVGAGFGGGDASRSGFTLTRLEGGVRQAIGPAGLRLWVTRTAYGVGAGGQGGLGESRDPSSDSLTGRRVTEYTDVGSRATVALGSYELGATLVRRVGGSALRRTAWELSGVWWIARSSVGLVGATGHSLPQFGLAVPGARYGTLGVRLALGSRGGRVRRPAAPPVTGVGTAVPRVAVEARRRLTLAGPVADSADVIGDFTDWEPRRLEAQGVGRWSYPAALPPGVHQLNVRFDGGPWMVPSGTVPVDDGFGGRAGMFVVR